MDIIRPVIVPLPVAAQSPQQAEEVLLHLLLGLLVVGEVGLPGHSGREGHFIQGSGRIFFQVLPEAPVRFRLHRRFVRNFVDDGVTQMADVASGKLVVVVLPVRIPQVGRKGFNERRKILGPRRQRRVVF